MSLVKIGSDANSNVDTLHAVCLCECDGPDTRSKCIEQEYSHLHSNVLTFKYVLSTVGFEFFPIN